MAHAARIEDSIVTRVIVVPNGLGDDEEITAYCNEIGLDGTWIRTSYNASIRGKFAGFGDTYDSDLDEFISSE